MTEIYESLFPYSGTKRKRITAPVKGIGTNDVDRSTKIVLPDGTKKDCPIYATWVSMLERTTEKWWTRAKHYEGTTVCDEWLLFSNFRRWMITQNWYGKQLDKDIINPYAKEYNPENCRFVPRNINVLLTERHNHRGLYPLGVTKDKSQKTKVYQSQCSMEGITSKKLGRFLTPMEAHRAYQLAKASEIIRVASLYYDSNEIGGDVYCSLIMRANKVYNEYENGEETISIHHY